MSSSSVSSYSENTHNEPGDAETRRHHMASYAVIVIGLTLFVCGSILFILTCTLNPYAQYTCTVSNTTAVVNGQQVIFTHLPANVDLHRPCSSSTVLSDLRDAVPTTRRWVYRNGTVFDMQMTGYLRGDPITCYASTRYYEFFVPSVTRECHTSFKYDNSVWIPLYTGALVMLFVGLLVLMAGIFYRMRKI